MESLSLFHLFTALVACSCAHVASAHGPSKIYGMHRVDPPAQPLSPSYGIDILNRSSFPRGFIFGSATSAYQIEGAWNLDGKGPSNWDHFTHTFPEKIADRKNGNVACNSYHKYKDDIKLLKRMNIDSYRLSISWSRILPHGKLSGGVNEKGIEYYHKVFDELHANGITPLVTLFHWDVPQGLDEEYGGFLSPKVVEDFLDYANICFERFGQKVKQWITFNEPWSFSRGGYDEGVLAPGRCSAFLNNNCTGGDSATEPYLVSHHQLLAHAAAVKLYKQKYQAWQKGTIGISLIAFWMVPMTNSTLDREAAKRAIDFQFGWYMDPLRSGKYPRTMRRLVGPRLPKFTAAQAKDVKKSYDFIGLNYYSAFYVSHVNSSAFNKVNTSYTLDQRVQLSVKRHGRLIGAQAASDWLHFYPRGIYDLLIYMKKRYRNPLIYITENGVDSKDNATLPLREALRDSFRIRYYHGHLHCLLKAIQHGVKVRGYYAWSIVDNFEWAVGYTVRFGIHHVDFKTSKRYPKSSALWFRKFLHN